MADKITLTCNTCKKSSVYADSIEAFELGWLLDGQQVCPDCEGTENGKQENVSNILRHTSPLQNSGACNKHIAQRAEACN